MHPTDSAGCRKGLEAPHFPKEPLILDGGVSPVHLPLATLASWARRLDRLLRSRAKREEGKKKGTDMDDGPPGSGPGLRRWLFA